MHIYQKLSAAAVFAMLAFHVPAQTIVERKVSVGNAAPGFPPGATFAQLGSSAIDADGRVSFNAVLQGAVGVHANHATYSVSTSGALTAIMKGGDLQPGAPSGLLFDEFKNIQTTVTGQVYTTGWYYDSSTGAATSRMGVWSGVAGPMSLGLLTGPNLLVGAGVYVSSVTPNDTSLPFVLAERDVAMLYLQLEGTGVNSTNRHGIGVLDANGFRMVAREGDLAPGFSPAKITSINWPGLIDLDGNPMFSCYLNDAVGTQVLYRVNGSVLSAVLSTGQAVDGLEANAKLSYFNFGTNGCTSPRGEFAFVADYVRPGGSGRALIAGPPNALRSVLKVGDIAPGLEATTRIGSILVSGLDNSGRFCIRVGLTGPGIDFRNNLAIYMGRAGNLRVVARVGDLLAGTLANTKISYLDIPVMNQRGLAASSAELSTNDSVSSATKDAVLVLGEERYPRVLARAGDLVQVGTNVPAAAISPSVRSSARASGIRSAALNDSGQLLFQSGVFGYGTSLLVTTLPASCDADFNSDGFVDFTDFDAFIASFELGDAGGDFNSDGFIDFTDFDAFVAAFEAGC